VKFGPVSVCRFESQLYQRHNRFEGQPYTNPAHFRPTQYNVNNNKIAPPQAGSLQTRMRFSTGLGSGKSAICPTILSRSAIEKVAPRVRAAISPRICALTGCPSFSICGRDTNNSVVRCRP